MPSPNPGESREQFLDRCMGDGEAVADFPDQDQRFAFCNAQWDRQQKSADIVTQKGLEFWSASWLDVVPRDGQWRELATFRHYQGMSEREARVGEDIDGFCTHKSLRFGECFGLRWSESGEAVPKRGGVLADGDWSRPAVTKARDGWSRIERVETCWWRPLAAGPDFLEWQEKREAGAGASYRVRRWEREGLRIVDNIGQPLVRRGRPDVAWAQKGTVLWAREPRRPIRGLELVDIEAERESRLDVTVLKRDDEKRYTLGVVYFADRPDAHRDQMTPEELERAAWGYMRRSRRVGIMHQNGTDGSGEVVESYIYRGPDWDHGDVVVRSGDWLQGTIWGTQAWEAIKSGKLTGYSLQGMANRVPG